MSTNNMLPEMIGNGRLVDNDDNNSNDFDSVFVDGIIRGGSLYLDEATDVSYSEEGTEISYPSSNSPTDNPSAATPAQVQAVAKQSGNDENGAVVVDVIDYNEPRSENNLTDKNKKSNNSSNKNCSSAGDTKESKHNSTDAIVRKRNTKILPKSSDRSWSYMGTKVSSDHPNNNSNNNSYTIEDPTSSYYTPQLIQSKPYKIELLRQQLVMNSPGIGRRNAIVSTLRDMGIQVYVIDGRSSSTSITGSTKKSKKEVLKRIKQVIKIVSLRGNATKNNDDTKPTNASFPKKLSESNKQQQQQEQKQFCLLYHDEYGRLFNLTVPTQLFYGSYGLYSQYYDTFSIAQAIIALTVLSRSFPCMVSDDTLSTLRPAYLSLILGFVLKEEISLSWLNASMMIRRLPSVSAHTLVSNFIGSDYLRKGVVLSLALAGAATGTLRSILTVGGISTSVMILLSNLGSRSWHHLQWKSIGYQGFGSTLVSYFFSIATGIVVPFLGHRSVSMGDGKGAIEYLLRTSTIVATVFVLSDYDDIQKFLVVGSEVCNQDSVNMIVAAWWCMTVIVSLFVIRRHSNVKKSRQQQQEPSTLDPHVEQYQQQQYHKQDEMAYDGELFLQQDQSSPVGYKVPGLPDYEIDPSTFDDTSSCFFSCCSLEWEFLFGLLFAAGIGCGLLYLAVTELDDELFITWDAKIQNFLHSTMNVTFAVNETLLQN